MTIARPITNPATEARDFRIWQILKMEDFRCTYQYVAEVMGMPKSTVRLICLRKGWHVHFEDDADEARSHAGGSAVAVDKVMLDRDNFSRITWFSKED